MLLVLVPGVLGGVRLVVGVLPVLERVALRLLLRLVGMVEAVRVGQLRLLGAVDELLLERWLGLPRGRLRLIACRRSRARGGDAPAPAAPTAPRPAPDRPQTRTAAARAQAEAAERSVAAAGSVRG
ncbi:hypothetical protein ACFSVJ_11730 [Prauserella oleivorans]